MNIACWSGPRNLSTALMYSFGARSDCAVVDEPFYAAFLQQTGLDHPMREQVLAEGEADLAKVAATCCQPPAAGQPFFYQKHMTHHMLADFELDWLKQLRNVFLIRHPARVLASYAKKRENPTLEDIGFAQRTRIFDYVQAMGLPAVVVNSFDIRQAPEATLIALCEAIGMPFSDQMLRWPAGGHPDDGVWAAHWYDAVHKSTGFAGPEGPLPPVAPQLQGVYDQAMAHYERLLPLAI